MKKKTTEQFIEEAKAIHGDKYNYSKLVYVSNAEKVCIVCPIHGEFWQRARHHLDGHGCQKCANIEINTQNKRWTQERCFEEASKYQESYEFQKQSPVAYSLASRNGWLKDYSWLKVKKHANGYWTESLVLEEARKYKSKSEFQKSNHFLYIIACKNKWIEKCTWFSNPVKMWNHESCFNEAKKFTVLKDFRTGASSAYTIARRNGWLKEYTWLQTRTEPVWNKKWTYGTCFEEAKKYKTKGQFGKMAGGAYDVALKNGWLKDYTWFPDFQKSDSKVDSVYCYFFQEQNAVYVGRTLMYRQHRRDIEHCNMETDTVYKYAKENSLQIPQMTILEDNLSIEAGKEREDFWRNYYESQGCKILNVRATGKKSSSTGALGFGKWTYEQVFEIAKKYESIAEFDNNHGYLYKLAKSKGWINSFTWFRGQEIKLEKATIFTEDYCRAEALKHKTRKGFRAANKGAYNKAKKTGWMEEYDWLEYSVGKKRTFESCKEAASRYKSKSEFCKEAYGDYTFSRKNGWLDEFFPSKK